MAANWRERHGGCRRWARWACRPGCRRTWLPCGPSCWPVASISSGTPYDGWFGSLQRIIEPTGHSYYAPRSDACHLDVVPWATASKWGTLSLASRRQLARLAAQALADMIASSPLTMLVLNGKEVVSHFEALVGLQLRAQRVPAWDLPRRSGRPVPGLAYSHRISSIAGVPLDRDLLVAGYNHNLQSSFGVTTAVRASISEWITTQYRAITW